MPSHDVSVSATLKDKLYTLTVVNGTGSGSYKRGALVGISANVPDEALFTGWSGATVSDPSSSSTTLSMPNTDTSVSASFTDRLYTLTVSNGTGSGKYKRGTPVAISAEVPPGKVFSKWTGHKVDSESSASTTLAMPASDASVSAVLVDRLYTLTVVNGTGSGSYKAGELVPVRAMDPPSGGFFDHWDGQVSDPTAVSTTLAMPGSDTTVSAVYRSMGWKATASVSSTRSLCKGQAKDAYSATVALSLDGKGPDMSVLLPDGTEVAMSIGGLELSGKASGINPKSGSGKFTLEGDGATATVSVERRRVSAVLKRKDNGGSVLMDLSGMASGKVSGSVAACLVLGGASWSAEVPWSGTLKKDKKTGLSTWSVSGKLK
jgi:hypothetical protein